MYSTYKLECKNVNSKILTKEIVDFIDDCFQKKYITRWDREELREDFVDFVFVFMNDLQMDGKVEYFKIICDSRNNTNIDMKHGTYHFDIQYKQTNCLNITEIKFTIDQIIDPTWYAPFGMC